MLHDKLMKMLGKKRDLSGPEKDAKMNVVKDMRDMASDSMKDKLNGLKKVSVMSDSDEGLEQGLDKAKNILSPMEEEGMKEDAENPYHDVDMAHQEHESDEGGLEDEMSETPEEESEEHPDEENEFHGLDMDEVHKKLQKLMQMRDSMMKKS